MKNHWKLLHLLTLGALLLTACATPQATPTPAPTDSPLPPPPTATTAPLPTATPGQPALPTTQSVKESGKSPDYTLSIDTPVLDDSYPHSADFNQWAASFVQKEVIAFKKNLADWTPTPATTESAFIMQFTALPYNSRYVSIQFKEEYYMAGAAHPAHQIFSLVFDLENGQPVTLEQLFNANSAYLQKIADYCKAELSKREIAFDAQQTGADPTPENYAVWNISTDGLVITFNEYQVAAYAAGPQTVIIPYNALKEIINPQGPLGSFAQ